VTALANIGSSHVIFWDTTGSETYRAIVPLYFRDVRIIVIVYDLSSRESFDAVRGWVQFARRHGPNGVTVMLVGSKADLGACVTSDEAQALSLELELLFVGEASAKTGHGVHDLLGEIGSVAMEPIAMKRLPNPAYIDDSQPQEKSCRC
jgi:small GTP-binding protein